MIMLFFFQKEKPALLHTHWMIDSMLIVVLAGQNPNAGANNEDNI